MAVPATANKQRAVKPAKGGLERRNRYGILFCLPFVIAFLVFNIYPVLRTFQMSFMNYKGFGKETFVWFDNYIRAFKDPLFRDAFGNTLKMWGVNIVLQLGLALLLTIIFNDIKYRMKGLSVFRALFYLPNLIACTSVAFLFKTLLDWRFGSINQILMAAGIISSPINWLTGEGLTAQMVVGVVGAWMWFGNSFIMLMAGVQGIDKSFFEAATIDGAGRWQIFSKITMPLLRPIMLYVAVTSLIGGLQLFDLPYLLSGTKGEPGRSLYTSVFYIYTTAFTNHQMGYAAALAFVLFLILLSALCFTPFWLMIVNATRSGNEIMTGFSLLPGSSLAANWKIVSENMDLGRGFLNSLFLALCNTALVSYFSALTAYGLAYYKFKGAKVIFTALLIFMMVPSQLSMLGFYDLVNQMGLIDTYWPLILPSIASPATVFFLRQYILSVMPKAILEAPRIDGASELKIFHSIVLPIMAPGIATMAIGAFIGSWNNYLIPMLIINTPAKRPLPVMVAELSAVRDITTNMGATYLVVAISAVPIMIAFCFFSKYIISGISAGSVKE